VTVVIMCPECRHAVASVSVAVDGTLTVTGRATWLPADRLEVRPDVDAHVARRGREMAHELVALGCRDMDCGWTAQICACQLRDQAAQGRGARPWRWTPTAAELRAALLHAGNDPAEVERYGPGQRCLPEGVWAIELRRVRQPDGSWRWVKRIIPEWPPGDLRRRARLAARR
jgi:hypothetical protein